MIDNRAIIHPSAQIDESAQIKPYAVIGKDVVVGANTTVDSHAQIDGPTTIGKNNHIFSFASVGSDPQDVSYATGQKSNLEIGDNNIIREFCTINRGTEKQNSLTKIGSHNMLMSYTHIAHDCILGDHIIMANNASLAGHVILEDYVFLGGFTLIKQFCRLGQYTYTAMGCMIAKDIPPFLIISNQPLRVSSINNIGLKRRGLSANDVSSIKRAFKAIYREDKGGELLSNVLNQLEKQEKNNVFVAQMIDFIKNSDNVILRGSYE